MVLMIGVMLTALLSSAATVFFMHTQLERRWQRRLEQRLQEWQLESARLTEQQARMVVAEALADINAGEVLRDATWKVARSGSDLLGGRLSSLLGRRRRREAVDAE